MEQKLCQNTFKRYEIKYLITQEQKQDIIGVMERYMQPDAHGRSTICNVYFDTSDKRLIRRSLEKPVYKEKLRLRSYGIAAKGGMAFVELKKKYKGVVYKRRLDIQLEEAEDYLYENVPLSNESQISHEIDYFKSFYGALFPSAFISYERTAFYSQSDQNFRITFDNNILWRDFDMYLDTGIYGNPLLLQENALMEVKTANSVPLWLSHELNRLKVNKTSFSKYGNAYKEMLEMKMEQGRVPYDIMSA